MCVWELEDPRKQKPRADSHRPRADDRLLLLPLSRSSRLLRLSFFALSLQAPQDEGLFPRVSVAGPSIGCFLCAGLGLPSKAGSESEARGISVSLAFTLSLISTTVLIIYQMGIMTLQVNISFKEVWLIQKTLDSSVLCFT